MFSVYSRRSVELSGGRLNKENTVIFCLFFPVLRVIPSIRACLAWFLWSFVWKSAEGLLKTVQIIFPLGIECMWLQTSRTSVVRSCMLDHMWKRSQTQQSVKTQLKSFLFSCKSNTTSLFSAVRISHVQTVSGLVRVTAVLDLMALSCSLRSHSSPLTRRTAARGSSDEETRRGGSWLTDAILSGKWVQFCASHKNNTNSLSVLTLNKKYLGIYTLRF